MLFSEEAVPGPQAAAPVLPKAQETHLQEAASTRSAQTSPTNPRPFYLCLESKPHPHLDAPNDPKSTFFSKRLQKQEEEKMQEVPLNTPRPC